MSSSDRRAFLLATLALAGCGFRPAYAPGGPAETLQGAIRVDDPTDKNGFDLVERLEERLGRPEAPRFDLHYRISTDIDSVGITSDNSITRYNLSGRIDFTVEDRTTGKTVDSGTVTNFTSWSATGSTVAALVAEQDASYRLMRILADQIVTQLIATSGRWLG
ncbi:LPS assembly lipoprotein LptE [Cereibacter sphaeroides]|uniref:LPS assembly lipoprotein LptE n=1 Tax=Rhodobacterales TaxID=204455 RepID=UPI000BBE7C31|nr:MULTISPECIES: LPS assembly lipoprotein LptE [Paracoccaceae]MCE6949991.1 LPS assembly lipoprotein LptE [Cereibacter sphaeroides]